METANLNQPTYCNGVAYLFDGIPFSGFAIETFPDGTLQTQISFMHGREDGVTRRCHPNGQLESEKSFRNGQPHGRHREWRADGTLKAQSAWSEGTCIDASPQDGVPANPRSTAADACITHYGYDPYRQTYVKLQPERAPVRLHY